MVDRAGHLDELTIQVESEAPAGSDEARAICSEMAVELKARLMVRAVVEVVPTGTFAPQVFKARRVIDHRAAT